MATWLKVSTAVDVKVGPFVDSTDGFTPETALTITQPDILLGKNGGAFAQKNAAQTLAHESIGWYEVALDTTDTNTLGILILAIYEVGALPVWREFMVVPANVYDGLISGTGVGPRADVQGWLGTAPATPTVAGVPEVDPTHWNGTAVSAPSTAGIPEVNVKNAANVAWASGAITAAVIAADAIDDDAIATGAIASTAFAAGAINAAAIATDAIGAAELADGAITAATFAASAIDATAIATGAITAAKFAAGAIDAAAIATDAIGAAELAADAVTEIAAGISIPSAATVADAVWDEDATAHQTTGTFGQAIGDPVADTNTIYKAVVTDAAGATVGVDVVAVKAETAAILDDTDDIGVAGAGLTDINLPNQTMDIVGNITGNLSGSVGSVTGAVGSVTGAVGSVTGAVGSVTGTVGSVTGNVGGNVTGSIGSLATQAKVDVNTEVLDVLNVDTFAEPGQGTPAATVSLVAKIGYLYKAWRNRSTTTLTEYALYGDDAVTKDQEAVLSDDGTTGTKGEVSTGA